MADHGVIFPGEDGKGKTTWPIGVMQVGDTFSVAIGLRTAERLRATLYATARNHGKRVSIRSLGSMLRVECKPVDVQDWQQDWPTLLGYVETAYRLDLNDALNELGDGRSCRLNGARAAQITEDRVFQTEAVGERLIVACDTQGVTVSRADDETLNLLD